MSLPLVVCVMPYTVDRIKFLNRAAKSFLAQDYPNKVLWSGMNDGTRPLCHVMNEAFDEALDENPGADFLCKWDSDDWSAPQRISDQVRLIQRSCAMVVGYNEMPFLDEETGLSYMYRNPQRTYALGTSLLFRPQAFREYRFPDTTDRNPRGRGSDTQFVHHWASRDQLYGISGMVPDGPLPVQRKPTMIASMNGGIEAHRSWCTDGKLIIGGGGDDIRELMRL